MEGTYRPEWRAAKGRGKKEVYFADRARDGDEAVAVTTRLTGTVITRRHIQHFGFQLLYNDQLPREVKEKLHANEKIPWSIPRFN